MNDLASRAVACKGWRWMDGMVLFHCATTNARWRRQWQGVWCSISGEQMHCLPGDRANGKDAKSVHFRACIARGPDLTDPATLGCLLSLVREAWGDPGICVRGMLQSDGRYQWYVVGGHAHGGKFSRLGIYSTEAEVLVAALEAAP